MAKRIKKMPIEQFQEVMKRNWKPVELVGSASPDWLKNIPKDVLNSIVASGTNIQGLEYSDKLISSGQLIGGIDVYRNAPDDPVELNKDWYAVVKVPESDTMLMISGPILDDEHWPRPNTRKTSKFRGIRCPQETKIIDEKKKAAMEMLPVVEISS